MFRLVNSGGIVVDPAMVNCSASGTIWPNKPVAFLRTSGLLVGAAASTTTGTALFGVSMDYVQGASDAYVRVIPFNDAQLWEVDCANAATTAQVGIRHTISATDAGYIHNTASDVTSNVGHFLAFAMTGSTSGSGKLIGRFINYIRPVGQNQTTYL